MEIISIEVRTLIKAMIEGLTETALETIEAEVEPGAVTERQMMKTNYSSQTSEIARK